MERRKRKIEVDFVQLLRLLWKDRRMVLATCLAAALVGLALSFCVPRKYKSSVMLAPEDSGSNLLSNFSSLASMVGMDMKMNSSNDAIYPEIYPDLMQSTDFLAGLFDVRVTSRDGRIDTTYYAYMDKFHRIPFWEYPKAWATKLVRKLSAKDPGASEDRVDPFRMTRAQFDIMEAISGDIDCSVDKKTSVITIEVTAQDPLIAACLADSVKDRLQAAITDYRTTKARNDLAYVEGLQRDAKDSYTEARQEYASYSDANQDLLLESYRSMQEELENELQLKYNIYTQVTTQVQMAMAKVQERTPAFTVVQSASVPVKHSNTPKLAVMVAFAVLWGVAYACFLAFRNRREIFRYVG